MKKQTGRDYRAKNRARLQRYYKRQAESGKRRISALLSGDIYFLLINEKNKTGSTISDIVEAALLSKFSTRKPKTKKRINEPSPMPRISDVAIHQTDVTISIPSQMDLFNQDNTDLIPDFKDGIMGIMDRDKMLLKVAETMPGKQNAKARVHLLNLKGVPVNTRSNEYGGKWDPKKFTDNLRLARKRLEKNK
jgi:hypothetical protein